MADWAKMRDLWKNERDKHVKKGAVSGVSIGDAIDAVNKARSKGYTSINNALDGLEKDVGKYKAKLAKTAPDLIKWMDKTLAGAVKETRSEVALDLDSLKWMIDNMLAGSLLNILTILPDDGKIRNVLKVMNSKDNPVDWKDAVKAVNMFYVIENYGVLLAQRAKTMKETKWAARLSGHDADYQALIDFADIVLDDVKHTVQWSKATSLEEWANKLKEMKGKQTALDHLPLAQKAMKHLMA